MKISLPENKSDITLGQYQRYISLYKKYEDNSIDVYEFNRRKIAIFTNIDFKDTLNIIQVDFESIVNQIDIALNEEVGFTPRFKIDNIEFGFIPNLDKVTNEEMRYLEALNGISQSEFIDGHGNINEVENLHKLIAVLFRPITNSDSFSNYEIAEYNGTKEYCELMKLTPLNIVDGAVFFFINLSIELQNYIQKYTKEVQKKGTAQVTTSQNGVGTQQ